MRVQALVLRALQERRLGDDDDIWAAQRPDGVVLDVTDRGGDKLATPPVARAPVVRPARWWRCVPRIRAGAVCVFCNAPWWTVVLAGGALVKGRSTRLNGASATGVGQGRVRLARAATMKAFLCSSRCSLTSTSPVSRQTAWLSARP